MKGTRGSQTKAALIKTIRTKMGLTQKQLAEKLGVHKALISMMEQGVSNCSHKNWNTIKQIFPDSVNMLKESRWNG
jgi:transcriptional regulator with XRE-family HTH domain